MKKNSKTGNSVEQRTSPRNYLDIFYSVEITVSAKDHTSQCYQFKLRNISESGMCVLVSEKSEILNHLQAGSVIDIKYCPVNPTHPHQKMRTQIKHITYVPSKKTEGKGHYYVGLLIMGKQVPPAH